MPTYVTEAQLARQIGKPNLTPDQEPKLTLCCQAAEDQLNNWVGRIDSMSPVPSTISLVALSLAVDLWKQPDATFGVIGSGETGMIRIARDLLNRYDSLLIPYYDSLNGWGVA
jgi:hypothetical protein